MFDWLPEITIQNWNRIGIVLQTLSFVLVTPQLLGEERIEQMETWLEKSVLSRMYFALTKYAIESMGSDYPLEREFNTLRSRNTDSILQKRWGFWQKWIVVISVPLTIIIILQSPSFDYEGAIFITGNNLLIAILASPIIFVCVIFVLVHLMYAILIGILLLASFVQSVQRYLHAEDGIRNLMFFLGVIFFFIASFIQFMAV